MAGALPPKRSIHSDKRRNSSLSPRSSSFCGSSSYPHCPTSIPINKINSFPSPSYQSNASTTDAPPRIMRADVSAIIQELLEKMRGEKRQGIVVDVGAGDGILLNFKVSPVLDLQVTPTDEDCVLELISCKFDGSEAVGRQNEHFSASMRNHITWETVGAEQYLDIDVTLDVVLEIYTLPFTLMPISAVERPGNIRMQVLVDRLVPLLIQQLLQRYEEWIQLQLQCSRSLPLIDNEFST